jgi:DNA-binding IscR family transcriptional regulator
LLESVQGAKGGYRLQPTCLQRTLLEVIEAADGPLQNSACIDRGLCEPDSDCPLEVTLEPAVEALRRVLSETRVMDLVKLDRRGVCCSKQKSCCP